MQIEVGGKVELTWHIAGLRSTNRLTVKGFKHPTVLVTVSAFTVDGTFFSAETARRSA